MGTAGHGQLVSIARTVSQLIRNAERRSNVDRLGYLISVDQAHEVD
jgi:hypothetical protein